MSIIERIRTGDKDLIKSLYLDNRLKFAKWAHKNFIISIQDIEDIWQDTIIIFAENVNNGKLKVLNSNVTTYLFGIGRNLIYKKLEKDRRVELPGDLQETPYLIEEITNLETGPDKADVDLISAMDKLGAPCKEMLIKRFYDKLTTEEMMKMYNFSSKNVVSVSLSRCLSRLRNILKEKM
ncbi:MAG: sigma-70 family RNA polymerase sigma factor [Saprospiraceae bacterium]|nr:sigma-70 family RNA polymerase sigma factor [Saprospiraceae bacterium]